MDDYKYYQNQQTPSLAWFFLTTLAWMVAGVGVLVAIGLALAYAADMIGEYGGPVVFAVGFLLVIAFNISLNRRDEWIERRDHSIIRKNRKRLF